MRSGPAWVGTPATSWDMQEEAAAAGLFDAAAPPRIFTVAVSPYNALALTRRNRSQREDTKGDITVMPRGAVSRLAAHTQPREGGWDSTNDRRRA